MMERTKQIARYKEIVVGKMYTKFEEKNLMEQRNLME
jgi:hypothetical protein